MSLFRYTGTKKHEIKNFIKYIRDCIESVDTIVEPFGGSACFSLKCIELSPHITSHINDLSTITFAWYQHIKNNTWAVFIEECIQYCNSFQQPMNNFEGLQIGTKMMNDNTPVSNYCHQLTALMPKSKSLRITKWANNIRTLEKEKTATYPVKNTQFTNLDFTEILTEYIDNELAMVFLDPPYMSTRDLVGDCYHTDSFADKHFLTIRDFIKNAKCKVLMIVLDSTFMRLCFDGYIKDSYDKTYSASKKKVKHLIITNY